MGLDIYLYSATDAAANKLHDDASNEYYERSDYDELTEARREELRAAIPPYTPHVDVPSERYPEHLFNRRYLRSSYNDGGYNNAVPQMIGGGGSLYWIFEPMGREWDGDEGTLTSADIPSLQESRKRADEVLVKLNGADRLRTMDATAMVGGPDHLWSEWPREDEVLAWYREEAAKHAAKPDLHGMGEGYSTAKGHVLGFTKGLEVLALTVGRDAIGMPCAIAVYRAVDGHESYVQSTEIVIEFIDEAISLIERDGSADLSWSG